MRLRMWLLILVSGVIAVGGLAVVLEAACTDTPTLLLCKPARGDVDWDLQLNSNFDKIDALAAGTTALSKLNVSGAGPHVVGGATAANIRLYLTGAFTAGAGTGTAVRLDGAITPVVGADAVGLLLAPVFVEAGSGTHADFIGARLDAPSITPGAAALTNASTLKITGAPSGATNNYAMWQQGCRN
jgi:hypothetical protein